MLNRKLNVNVQNLGLNGDGKGGRGLGEGRFPTVAQT